MTEGSKYLMLKQAAVLMALDAGGAVANTGAFFVRTALENANTQAASLPTISATPASLYVSWTFLGLRLLIWSLTLALLSRMIELHPSFGKARIWYLLRILVFVVEIITVGAAMYMYHNHITESLIFVRIVILLELGLGLLWEVLLLSFGNRAVLSAGANLLDSFGMEEAAKKNRRCGKWLIGFAAVYAFFWTFAFTLLLIWRVEFPEGFPEELFLLDVGAFLFCVPAWFGSEICRIFASLRMNRVYRLIRELSE